MAAEQQNLPKKKLGGKESKSEKAMQDLVGSVGAVIIRESLREGAMISIPSYDQLREKEE